MHNYLRSFASTICLTLASFTVCAQQTAGWGLKADGNILSAQHSGSVGGDIPLPPDTPFVLPEFTSNTMEKNPWLREILEQAASKKAIKGIGPIIKSLLEYAYWWGNQDETLENPQAPNDFTMEQEDRSRSEFTDDSMLDFFSWNESEHSTENTVECTVSLNWNNTAIPQPAGGNSPLSWIITLAKYTRENIGHEISACLSSHGIDHVDTSYAVGQLIAALSRVKENSTDPEPCDAISTPPSIQGAAAEVASDYSPASMVTVNVSEEEEVIKGLKPGRYLLAKTNDQRLVVAFHHPLGENERTYEEYGKLIKPQVSLADRAVFIEVAIVQDDNGDRFLSSRRPPPSPMNRVCCDGPRREPPDLTVNTCSSWSEPETMPSISSTFYPDGATRKLLCRTISAATLYLVDVDNQLMYPLYMQEITKQQAHIIANIDSEFAQDWGNEIESAYRQVEMMSLKDRVEALEEKAGQLSSEIVLEPSFSKLKKEVDKQARILTELEETKKTHAATIAELQNKQDELTISLQTLLAASYNGRLVWKIPEVRRRVNEAKTGQITSLYSAPFYTSKNGYKMCLRVYLNGDGIGRGTHVSCFLTIMRGEFDALLPWPFPWKVILTLMERSGEGTSQNFIPSPKSSSFWRPTSEMNIACGCPRLAKVEVLYDKNFIGDDDTIFLKAEVVLDNTYRDPVD